jgi:pimeloyl-ACP methyl ester carboxylesterase
VLGLKSLLLLCVLGLGAAMLVWSPGYVRPFLDASGLVLPGSIADKIRVNINGVMQGMIIRSKDATQPVLLFLHGGPGMPAYFLTDNYPTGLEEDFTVVWWDQRGAGLSYSPAIPPETMTVQQLIADTVEVTNYLRLRFGQEKIYLMGHSWGSFLGIQVAAAAPHLYHAYIGMGQITYQLKSERLAYEYMLKQFRAKGDTGMVRKLEAAPVTMTDPVPAAYMGLRDKAMHNLGVGTTRDMNSVITGMFLASLQCAAYTLSEKVNIWRGKAFSRRMLWETVIATDLTSKITKLDLPVYIWVGAYDYTTSYSEAKSYFGGLSAPRKGFYTFAGSAHSPLFEEPEHARRILREDVLMGTASLADPK